jgi:hypothetical protein
MSQPRVRFTVRGMMIAVAVVSILLGGIVLSLRPGCRLRVVNRSGQTISQLTVTVSGERVVIENLADGSSATVPIRGRESPRVSVAGALMDKTPIRSEFGITGDPKRFAQVIGTVEPGGRFRRWPCRRT